MKLPSLETQLLKRKRGKCVAAGCSQKGYKYKEKKRERFCTRHKHQWQKDNNLVAYVYNIWKNNALKRGKVHTITLEYFKKWCQETDYIKKRGRHGGMATIDRIKDNLGYIPGNIQVLTCRENSRKQWTDYWGGQNASVASHGHYEKDLPF